LTGDATTAPAINASGQVYVGTGPVVGGGTGGGVFDTNGTVPTKLVSGASGFYGNSTNSCFDIVNGTTDAGCAMAASSASEFTRYNNIALVNNGVPSEVFAVNSSNSAAITATTLYTPTATGFYRITAGLQLTTAATTSSILGGTTGIIIAYTDGTSSVAQSVTCYAVNQSAAIITIGTGNTGNSTTSQYNCIPMYIYAKTGVAITYAIGYTSVGATAMVYQAHLLAESM
jgi:hypothetical protein